MRAVLLLVALLVLAPMARAQPVPAELRIAGLSVAEHQQLLREIRAAARRAQASEAALTAVAQRMGELQQSEGGSVDITAILGALDAQASRVRALESQLANLAGGDAETARLRQEAAEALAQGRLTSAEALLLRVAEREVAGASSAMERAAQAFAASAQTAELQFAYSRSAPLWARSAELTDDSSQRWAYRLAEATAVARPDAPCDDDMCQEQTDAAGLVSISLGPGRDMLRRSVNMIETQVLPLAPRATRFAAWAETQTVLAKRYARLCDMGGDGERTALECTLSLEAFTAVLDALPPADPRGQEARWRVRALLPSFRIPADAATGQRADAALTRVLSIAAGSEDRWLSGRSHILRGDIALRVGDDSSLDRAIDEHRLGAAALRTITGEDAAWARATAAEAQNRIGQHLQGLANSRRDIALWREAARFFEATLALDLPAADQSRGLAAYQLGTSLLFMTELGEPFPFERAQLLFSSASQVYTRESDPERWAVIENNLGRCHEVRANALRAQGERGDTAAFRASVAAYDEAARHYVSALEVWTPGHAHHALGEGNLFRVRQRNVLAAAPASAPEEPPERGGIPAN